MISKLSAINALVCDDVRIENNGKHIIIGVYTGDIIVSGFPFFLTPCFWVSLPATPPGQYTVSIRYSYDGKIIDTFKAQFDVKNTGGVAFATPKVILQGESAADFVVEVSTDAKSWREIQRKKVLMGTVPSNFSVPIA